MESKNFVYFVHFFKTYTSIYIYIFISRSILSQLHRLNNQTDVFPNFYSFFPLEKNIIHRNEFTRKSKLNFYPVEPDKRNELIFKNLEE